MCYTSRSAPALPNCITKHHMPVKCIGNAISQGVARVCLTLHLGLGRRVRAFLVTQVKTQPLHRPDLGIAQPPGCRPASPLLETPRAELGCRQAAPPPIPWLWPLTLPPARPPTREPVPAGSSCSRRGRRAQAERRRRGKRLQGSSCKTERRHQAPPMPAQKRARVHSKVGWGHMRPPGHDHPAEPSSLRLSLARLGRRREARWGTG